MELLILGVILVALMAYASTRIKKNAAKAFDQELVEADDFSLLKPEGFLNKINGVDPRYVFQAYSKEFGKDEAENTRQATIDITISKGRSFADACGEAKKDSTSVIERKGLEVSGFKAWSIEAEREVDGSEMVVHSLIVDAPGRIFSLRSSVLKEHNNDFLRKIDEMEDSLEIKK
ncbi:MAG: hypothetical protein ABI999_08785 [Acidobacteriota bacterium]